MGSTPSSYLRHHVIDLHFVTKFDPGALGFMLRVRNRSRRGGRGSCPGPELRAAGAQILLRYFVFRGPNFAKFGCKFYFRTDFVLHFEMRNYCTKKRILYKQACFSCFTPSALITYVVRAHFSYTVQQRAYMLLLTVLLVQ